MTKVSDNLNRKLDDVNASVAARKADTRNPPDAEASETDPSNSQR